MYNFLVYLGCFIWKTLHQLPKQANVTFSCFIQVIVTVLYKLFVRSLLRMSKLWLSPLIVPITFKFHSTGTSFGYPFYPQFPFFLMRALYLVCPIRLSKWIITTFGNSLTRGIMYDSQKLIICQIKINFGIIYFFG